MSVVNKMLRDLENRKHHTQASANYIPPSKTKHVWLGGSALATLCVAVSVYFLLPSLGDAPDQDQTIQQAPADSITLEKGDQIAQISSTATPSTANTINASNDTTNLLVSQTNTAPILLQPTDSEPSNERAELAITANLKDSVDNKSVPDTLSASEFTIAASDGSKSELSKLRSLAHLASERGQDNEVISLLQQILQHEPKELRIRKQLAALLFSKSRLEDAQKTLIQGLQQTPADSGLRLMLSRIHFKTGKSEQALKILIQHPYNALANDELISFRAALAEKNGNYLQAQQDYQLLVKRNPLQAKWWLGLGVVQDKQKLRQEAIGSYQQAQQLNQLPAQVETFVEQRITLLARRS